MSKGSYYVIHDAQYCGKKCIAKKEHSEKENTKKLLKQERQFLVTLNHPCIVELLISSGSPKSPILLMERPWMNLCGFLANKPIHCDTATILQDVAYGLSYIHEKGIIHCNLTANSILLTEEVRAKLSDFGRAVFYQPKAFGRFLVTTDDILDYMPPEIFKPIPSYSTKLDVFSFGCVVIHTVSREPPIPDCDKFVKTSEVGDYKIYSEVERRSLIIKKLRNNSNLYRIVLKCLQDNPDDRPTSVALCSLLEIGVSKESFKHGMC